MTFDQKITETQNLVIIDLICPNQDPDEYFSRKVIKPSDWDQIISDQMWFDFVEAFNNCPHALSGKTLKVESLGTNPYVYTDFDRNVFYNDKGLPLGSNSDILSNIGKVYGFDVAINLSSSTASSFDNKTGKWMGQNAKVNIF
jgi:hypothetical protein